MTEDTTIRDTVRARYAAAATRSAAGDHDQARALEAATCSGASVAATDPQGQAGFGAALYDADAAQGAPRHRRGGIAGLRRPDRRRGPAPR